MKRGDVRWYSFRLPDKCRPVLVLTRNDIIDRVNEVVVVPATRTIRGLAPEVALTPDDGMPVPYTFNFAHVALAHRDQIKPWICRLPEPGWPELRRALLTRCGFVDSGRQTKRNLAASPPEGR